MGAVSNKTEGSEENVKKKNRPEHCHLKLLVHQSKMLASQVGWENDKNSLV